MRRFWQTITRPSYQLFFWGGAIASWMIGDAIASANHNQPTQAAIHAQLILSGLVLAYWFVLTLIFMRMRKRSK